MLGELVVVAMLACMAVMAAVYWQVPAGPECPRCGALTRELSAGGRGTGRSALDRLLFAVRCPVCGWDGRLRRRPPASELAWVRRGRRS